MNGSSGQITDNGTYPERAAARSAAQQTRYSSCAKRIERGLVVLPQEVTPRAGRKKTRRWRRDRLRVRCSGDRLFGGWINKNPLRPDCVDGALRTGAGVDRWCSDAFVLRPLEAARTTTTVDYKLGADVNRLRSGVFVLRF